MLIFDRTANGEVEPKGVIKGPKTGLKGIRQIQVYPPKGWIVISQITAGDIAEPEGTFVGVWSITDKGCRVLEDLQRIDSAMQDHGLGL